MSYKHSIGIGITTRNRYNVFSRSYKEWQRFLPKGAKLVVVDDCSDDVVPESTYRFLTNAGINIAKNKCLELLDDCEHIFLADDDIFPLVEDWYKQYVESGEKHMNYIFQHFVNGGLNDTHLIYRDNKKIAWSHPRGCLIYIHHDVLDVVGGMNPRFEKWGNEHVDYSNRIFNAGLTNFRYMDVLGSQRLFYSYDEHQAVASTVASREKKIYAARTRPMALASWNSTEYCPYKPGAKQTNKPRPVTSGKNIVLTGYFTGQPDPQRNTTWNPSKADIEVLAHSCRRQGVKLVVLNDCFENSNKDGVEYLRVNSSLNPYWQRWISFHEYLMDNQDIDKLAIVDATDVEMLHNPFPHIDPKRIYAGDEPALLGTAWMVRHHKVPFLASFIRKHSRMVLLNAGVTVGTYDMVFKFVHQFVTNYSDHIGNVGPFDMGLYNYTMRESFKYDVDFGRHVTTVFRTNDTAADSWFRHK